MIGIEFSKTETPRHKCVVLDTVKVSNTRTNLICVVCKEVVACWDDIRTQTQKLYPEVQHYAESTLNDYK